MKKDFSIKIAVAGICCLIKLVRVPYHTPAKSFFKTFISTTQPKIKITIYPQVSKQFRNLVKKNGKTVDIKEPEQVSIKKDLATVSAEAFQGTFNRKKKEGIFYVSMSKDIVLIAVRNIIRLCYALTLLDMEGCLIHGAGIKTGRNGYLMVGGASSGKSTAAGLIGKIILNDEFVVVRRVNHRLRIFGTPFGGDHPPSNQEVRLTHVFFLNKSRHEKIIKNNPIEGIKKILANEFLFMTLIGKKEKSTMKKTFKLISDLLQNKPSFDLFFKRDSNIRRMIDGLEKKA